MATVDYIPALIISTVEAVVNVERLDERFTLWKCNQKLC